MSHLGIYVRGKNQASAKIFSILVAFLLISGIYVSNSTLPSAYAVDCSATPGPGVDLSGCDLNHTDLSGVDLTNANLAGANLSFSTMDSSTVLSGTNLTGANLSSSTLEYAVFDNAILDGAFLIGADISGTSFRGLNLSDANFTQAVTPNDVPTFQFAILFNADFRGANLESADFTTSDLTNTNMQGSILRFTDFTQAHIHNALFSSSTIFAGAKFRLANMTQQNLSGLDLHGVTFKGANMSNANISNANLQSALFTCDTTACTDIKGANLSGSNVNGADFTDVLFNAQTNLSNLIGTCIGLAACSTGTTPPPVFNPVSNISTPATSPSGAVVFYSLPTATGALPLEGVVCTPESGSTFSFGITTVNCQVGYISQPTNIATTSFTVTVQDTSPPQFNPNPPSNVVAEASSGTGANVFYSLPPVIDNVGVTSETCTPVSGTLFALGNTPVLCTAKDAANNIATASFNVIVKDTTAPVISVPLPITKEATGPSGAAVTYSPAPAALDAVDPSPTLSCNPISGSTFSLGPHTVTCNASDHATPTPNTSSQTFTVTIVDTTKPVVTPPHSVTTVATGTLTPVTLGTATATDAVSGTLVPTNNAPSGGFPVGTTIVIWSATDGSGNVGTAQQIVTITPNTSLVPVVTPPPNVGPVEATGPLTTVALGTATAHDPVYGNLTPTNNAPSGGFPVGTTIVIWSATNPAHVTGTATQTVTIVDTTKPVFSPAPSDMTFDASNATSTVVNYPLPTATDAVGVTSKTCTPPPGSKFPLGPTLVTCTAKDVAGNIGTASFNIIIKDLSPPVIHTSHVFANATSQNGAIVNYPLPPVTDNIGVVTGSETCTPPPGSSFLFGDQTVTCTAKDAAGNVGSASFILTVYDKIPPTVIPPPNITTVATGTLTPVTLGTATATDAVSGTLVPTNNAPSGGFPVGTTIVIWSATDGSGNIGTAKQTVTITPATTPGKVNGGGSIGGETHYDFEVQSKDGISFDGHLHFSDEISKSSKIDLDSKSITSLAVQSNATVATFSGSGTLNGNNGYTFNVYIQDNGEPGKNKDFFGITIFDSTGHQVYTNSGKITSGNIQIKNSSHEDDNNKKISELAQFAHDHPHKDNDKNKKK